MLCYCPVRSLKNGEWNKIRECYKLIMAYSTPFYIKKQFIISGKSHVGTIHNDIHLAAFPNP